MLRVCCNNKKGELSAMDVTTLDNPEKPAVIFEYFRIYFDEEGGELVVRVDDRCIQHLRLRI